MIRPPPRSTLFPYPPLPRPAVHTRLSSSNPIPPGFAIAALYNWPCDDDVDDVQYLHSNHCHSTIPDAPGRPDDRSEEHTSELQSRSDLVCRLLLEKKKKK